MLTLLAFVVVVGTLVIVHEFGHYLVARWIGVRVETFSIGFPPTVYRRRIGETDFTVGLLPLGGFVKMAGDLPGEGGSDPRELQNRTRGERLAILFAGPAMNFLLAVALLSGLFYVGTTRWVGLEDPPVVSWIADDTPAAAAGLQSGDRIHAIDGDVVDDWRAALEAIALRPDQEVVFEVERSGASQTLDVRIASEGPDAIGTVGIGPPAPPLVGAVVSGTPAERAGLAAGDLIVAADGMRGGSTQEVVALVREGGERPIELVVEREGEEVRRVVTPELYEDPETGDRFPRVGVVFERPTRRVRAESVPDAMWQAVRETTHWGVLTVTQLGRFVRGAAPAEQFSGPIGIAQASGEAMRRGPSSLILLMAILSLSLGVLNLLPIPVLDGGQIAVLLFESVARRDIDPRTRRALTIAGAALMLVLLVLIIGLDLTKMGAFANLMGFFGGG